jgi:hypothetical protein
VTTKKDYDSWLNERVSPELKKIKQS